MSLLTSVTSGKQIGAQIHVIAGDNGVGKTTWASSFPNALVADLESGSNHLNVDRISADKLNTLEAVRGLLTQLLSADHKFKTLVIDSVESLEALICDAVCAEGKVDSIEDYNGGYGKGFTRTREIMREIMMDIQNLRTKGITTILVAHTQIKSKTDPVKMQTWDRVIMRCNDKMAAMIRDLSDNVFYATYKIATTKDNGKTRAFGDGYRVMYTQPRPGFDAKNRLELPLEIPLSYEAFAEACAKVPSDELKELVSDIKAMSEHVDEQMKKNIQANLEKFKGNAAKLKELKNRVMKHVAA